MASSVPVEVSFYDLSLRVRPGRVMVPRPATEALVDAAVARVADRSVRIADVGTGSGAIAVALAVAAPHAEVWASDVSAEALEVAEANARRHGVAERVRLVEGNLLDPVPGPLDLVVANLPYLPERLRPFRPEYLSEPPQAIFAPGDGLEHYRRLLETADEKLARDGGLVLQLHRRVVEAERDELPALRGRLRELSLAAA